MKLDRQTRRLLVFIGGLPIVLVVLALIYQRAVATFEGRERSFWRSLEWASETMTTTGYGSEAPWDHPVMVLLVIATQMLGLLTLSLLVPLVLVPSLEKRFSPRLPKEAPPRSHHIVIYRYGPTVETLLLDLLEAQIPVVLIETDEAIARRRLETKAEEPGRFHAFDVIFESSISRALAAASLGRARALIANGDDEENAQVILVAQELGFTGDSLALIEEPYRRHALALAGAKAVFTPRHVIGAALAARASHKIEPIVDGIQKLSKNLEVCELRIDPESFLAGKTLEQAEIRKRTGATIIGLWVKGRLDAHPKRATRLEARAVLIALGTSSSLEELTELATGKRLRRQGPFLIAGFGEVGAKVAELLRDVGEAVVVVDQHQRAGVDLVGDIANPEILDRLDLASSRGVILALDSDRATLFAAVVIRAAAPDLPLIARVNRAENVDLIHRAGADFALSISEVSAQILGHRLMNRDTRSFGTELRILRATTERMPEEITAALVRRRSGCSVVAIERGNEVLTEIPGDTTFEAQDIVLVCGHRSATERFAALYG
jgi:Trk K+ transport system NAD-binding subunit